MAYKCRECLAYMVERNIEAITAILMADSWPELRDKVDALEVLPGGES
jgi:hypothetical protein